MSLSTQSFSHYKGFQPGLYNTHGHKLCIPSFEIAQFVTECGIAHEQGTKKAAALLITTEITGFTEQTQGYPIHGPYGVKTREDVMQIPFRPFPGQILIVARSLCPVGS